MTPVGFSHSEISGSKPVCDSPELIAANYVLHRHLTPRHPSCALSSLTANLTRSPRNSSSLDEELRARGLCKNLIGRCCHHYYRDTPSQVTAPVGARTPTPGRSCGGSSGCGIGRDRSSSSELQPLDSIDARFHSLKTRLRVIVVLFVFQRASGAYRHPTQSLQQWRGYVDVQSATLFDSVERKGFEPSTPGLQSRCSPS
jgi:hypothetical protein